MTRATRKRWMIGTVVAVAVGIATAVAVGRYSQAKKKDDKAGRHAGVRAARGGAAGVDHDAWQHRVLRPAGGARHGGGARQGRRHAGGAGGSAKARVKAGQVARPHRPGRAAKPQQRAPAPALESARGRAGAGRAHAMPSNERLADQQFISAIALETSRAAARQRARSCTPLPRRRSTPRASACAKRRWWRRSRGIVAKRHVVPGEKVSMEQHGADASSIWRAGARRPGRHARGGAPATRHAGAGAASKAWRRR